MKLKKKHIPDTPEYGEIRVIKHFAILTIELEDGVRAWLETVDITQRWNKNPRYIGYLCCMDWHISKYNPCQNHWENISVTTPNANGCFNSTHDHRNYQFNASIVVMILMTLRSVFQLKIPQVFYGLQHIKSLIFLYMEDIVTIKELKEFIENEYPRMSIYTQDEEGYYNEVSVEICYSKPQRASLNYDSVVSSEELKSLSKKEKHKYSKKILVIR